MCGNSRERGLDVGSGRKNESMYALTADTSSTSIGRVIVLLTCPCFDTRNVVGSVRNDVAGQDVLHGLELTRVLTNTPNGNSLTVIENHVLNQNVGGVGLECDAIISVGDFPSTVCNSIGEHCVGAIGVPCWIAVAGLSTDEDVFEENSFGGDYCNRPE